MVVCYQPLHHLSMGMPSPSFVAELHFSVAAAGHNMKLFVAAAGARAVGVGTQAAGVAEVLTLLGIEEILQ